MHSVHADDPASADDVPEGQSVHDVAAVVDDDPGAQSSQVVAPTLLAYVPGLQLVQVDDFALAA